MSNRIGLDPKKDPDLTFIPYLYCLEILGKKTGLSFLQRFKKYKYVDFEKLNSILAKRFGECIYDEYFEILIKIWRIKKKYFFMKMLPKQIDEYLSIHSWLKVKFIKETYYWNFFKNEKSPVLPLDFQMHFSEELDQEKYIFFFIYH